jgi:hypothetical protein
MAICGELTTKPENGLGQTQFIRSGFSFGLIWFGGKQTEKIHGLVGFGLAIKVDLFGLVRVETS